MSKFHSYLDTTLRIIYINRYSGQSPEATDSMLKFLGEVESSSPMRHEILSQHLLSEHNSNLELLKVLAHESYHYLQGLFYPFLYYISWLELDNLFYLGATLRENEAHSIKINQVEMNPDFYSNMNFLFNRFEFYWENNHLRVKLPEIDALSSNILTLNDLLEDATSIFEYASNHENPTAKDYFIYLNNPENNCYKKTYRFLTKVIGIKSTYDFLPLIVQVAFSCSDPLTGFCYAVSYIHLKGISAETEFLENIFIDIMNSLESQIGKVILDPEKDHFIINIPVGVIHYSDLNKVIKKTNKNSLSLHYPLSVHFEKIVSKIANDAKYQNRILNFEKSAVESLITEFYPFAVHYNFKEFNGRNSTIVMDKDFGVKKTPLAVPYRSYIKDLIKIKESSLALFTRAHKNIESNCHHSNCEYYSIGLCKLWNAIPQEYIECGFPYWFGYYFNRKLDFLNLDLVKLNDKDADLYHEEYLKRSFKKRSFEYIKVDTGYVLTIDANHILEAEKKTMFTDFLIYLKDHYKEDITSLRGSITFDFYGFNDDERELFKIPEVVDFLKSMKESTPELFYYINFSHPNDHKLMLLPMFIQHDMSLNKSDTEIKFNQNSYNNFIASEAEIWIAFLMKNNIKDVENVFMNFKKIII